MTTALTTPICRRLGIRYPVFQAGMGWVARAELAAAVSAAGGLGVIGAGSTMTADELRDEIGRARAVTDKPFGVDILFATIRAEGDDVARYTDAVQAMVEVVLAERVPVLISGLGSPAEVVPEAKARGITVMSVVGQVRHALKAAGDGVDVVIASGRDGGGHVGEIGTAALVPAVVDAMADLGDVPVLAGGGLADGRGLAVALAFGAQGIWMGTRFIATVEARAHDNFKHRIVETDTAGTVVTRAHSGKPCRLIRNRFTDSWAGREAEIEPFPLQALKVGHAASERGRIQGDVDNGVLPAGQSSGLIEEVVSAGAVVEAVMAEAAAVLDRLQSPPDAG
ncbi:MAG: nitronate monooxygenase [Alphaproteobacteria bacterium]|jgi:enoyl-[acyl-carrier protein] reductase II|nr:nitronate monooxygenase [Alphaproteobacteria bacterium]